MGYRSGSLLSLFVLCCFLASAGCMDAVPTPPAVTALSTLTTPTPESPVVTAALSDMALQQDNLPSGYHLKDRTVASYSGVGQVFRDLGWQQGYRVSFYRLDPDINDITFVIQEIDIYPKDTVKDVYSLKKEELLPEEDSRTDYQVPFPVTGDRSIAWREVSVSGTVPIVTYTVIFTKKNACEKLSISGTSTDYELLRDLAAIAAMKVQ